MMDNDTDGHDRRIGAVCVIACPVMSGAVLGAVAMLCAYLSGTNAVGIGVLVACAAFLANAFAIGLTAATENRPHPESQSLELTRRAG